MRIAGNESLALLLHRDRLLKRTFQDMGALSPESRRLRNCSVIWFEGISRKNAASMPWSAVTEKSHLV
jgi:hypothetical protein